MMVREKTFCSKPARRFIIFLNISAVLHKLLHAVCLENTQLQPQSGHRKACAHQNALWLQGRCTKLRARRL